MALILVVDDEISIVEFLATVIEDCEHTVLCAYNGAQAFALARAHHPALIISDVMMPLMDGYALIKAVRSEPMLADTLVYLMSAAFARHVGAETGFRVNGYIAKPFDIDIVEGILMHLPTSE